MDSINAMNWVKAMSHGPPPCASKIYSGFLEPVSGSTVDVGKPLNITWYGDNVPRGASTSPTTTWALVLVHSNNTGWSGTMMFSSGIASANI